MKVDMIAEYSADYREYFFGTGKYYCTVPVTFDFAMNCPGMEDRVYYRKEGVDAALKNRIDRLGVHLLFWYDLKSKEILEVTVKYDIGYMVNYRGQQDMQQIAESLIAYMEKGEEGNGRIKQKKAGAEEQCTRASL